MPVIHIFALYNVPDKDPKLYQVNIQGIKNFKIINTLTLFTVSSVQETAKNVCIIYNTALVANN